jgi:acyl-homoserine lactone acylase PvdQ
MKWISIFSLLLFFSCKTEKQDPDVLRWIETAEKVTIIRDDFGIPHIYGKTDADAVFGLLYAQCEDDFKRVERNYIWALGRLSEVEGERELYSDLRVRLFMSKEEAIEQYSNSPKWLQKLCNAFADGINYYLYSHPEVQPKLLTHFEPWMPMYFSEGSIGGDIERVSTRRIKAFYEEKKSFPNPENLRAEREEEPKGSNGIAISGQLTESGNALLLINPHTSFYFRGEVHVVSEEGLNAYGAVTWGQFFVYQGFNEKTGWMHTSTYTDVIDEFQEEIIDKDGHYFYQFGDEQRKVEVGQVSLQYLEGETMKTATFPTYRTHHGPITHISDNKWTATALMWEPVKALSQSYLRTKQNTHEEFYEMMKIRTNSSNNTVYADADGNIAYYHGNFIPRRDLSFDYSKPVDGSNPKTDWQGLHDLEESIIVVNPLNGWIQNCNSTPFTSAAEYSPKVEDYPYYMSRNRENFRGIHAIKVLEDIENLNLDKLIDLAYDPYLPGFEKLIPGLLEAYDESRTKDPGHKEAMEILRNWDFTTSIESVAMTLAHYYGTFYNRVGEAPEGVNGIDRINYFGTDSPSEERLSIFSKAFNQLIDDFGRWDVAWGAVNRLQRIDGNIRSSFDDAQPSIPVGFASGRWGALASYGARKRRDSKRIYGSSGNSFVAVVEFGEKVKAKSILVGGQNGDPESPHFFDQAQRYVDRQFKDVAYYREDVEKRAKKKYKPGE